MAGAPIQAAFYHSPANDTSPTTLAFASPVPSGCGVIITFNIYNYQDTLTSVQDDKSNSYTVDQSLINDSGNFSTYRLSLFNITNGPQTLTYTWAKGGTNAFLTIQQEVWSGLRAFNVGNISAAGTTASTTYTSGSYTTTAKCTLIGHAMNFDGPPDNTFSAGSGFAAYAGGTASFPAGENGAYISEYQTGVAPQAITSTVVTASDVANYMMFAVAGYTEAPTFLPAGPVGMLRYPSLMIGAMGAVAIVRNPKIARRELLFPWRRD